jgi:hypothetical protein
MLIVCNDCGDSFDMTNSKHICSEPVSALSVEAAKPLRPKYRVIQVRGGYRAQVKWGPFWCALDCSGDSHLTEQELFTRDTLANCVDVIQRRKQRDAAQAVVYQIGLVVYEE